MNMVDMEEFRVQEEQNCSIVLAAQDATLDVTADDGHRGKTEGPRELLKIIVQHLNDDCHNEFTEADRVVNAIKQKLENDTDLRAAFQTNSIEFLRRHKLQQNIKDAFLSKADASLDFLDFMSKAETDLAFGKFFFSEMFKCYEKSIAQKLKPQFSSPK